MRHHEGSGAERCVPCRLPGQLPQRVRVQQIERLHLLRPGRVPGLGGVEPAGHVRQARARSPAGSRPRAAPGRSRRRGSRSSPSRAQRPGRAAAPGRSARTPRRPRARRTRAARPRRRSRCRPRSAGWRRRAGPACRRPPAPRGGRVGWRPGTRPARRAREAASPVSSGVAAPLPLRAAAPRRRSLFRRAPSGARAAAPRRRRAQSAAPRWPRRRARSARSRRPPCARRSGAPPCAGAGRRSAPPRAGRTPAPAQRRRGRCPRPLPRGRDARARGRRRRAGRSARPRVDVAGPEGLAEDALDEIALLVRGRAADERARGGPRLGQSRGRRVEGLLPRRGTQHAAVTHERLRDALLGGHRLVAPASLVAEPAVVDVVVVAREHPLDALVPDGELDVALARAEVADRPGALDVPRSCAEPVGGVRERPDRAQLDHVPRERRHVGVPVERADEGVVGALEERELVVLRHLLREAHAAVAEDAALAVDRDQG